MSAEPGASGDGGAPVGVDGGSSAGIAAAGAGVGGAEGAGVGGTGEPLPSGTGRLTPAIAPITVPEAAPEAVPEVAPEPDPDLLDRVFLTRVVEPGDEVAGRWVREFGVREVARRLRSGRALPGVSARRWSGLRARAGHAEPERDLAVARAAGVRFVSPGEGEWPGQLEDLGDARPLGLWARGPANLRIWALKSVALVGARACTGYGAHMAVTLASGLAERGWVVVSGGAYGVDGAAHRGALGAGGATVAVLACGVDRPYPRGHTELITRIAEQGLVVGELPPGDHPTPSRCVNCTKHL